VTKIHFADVLAATAIHSGFSEYATGKKVTFMFSQDEYQGEFCTFQVIYFAVEDMTLINHTLFSALYFPFGTPPL